MWSELANTPNKEGGDSILRQRNRKVIVFGGNGFIGSHIVTEALHAGYSVVTVSRTNPREPRAEGDEWPVSPATKREIEKWGEWEDLMVTHEAVDALDRRAVKRVLKKHLPDADAVISCVGTIGFNARFLKMTDEQVIELGGRTNENIAVSLKELTDVNPLPNLVLISAKRYPTPILKTYYDGKDRAEEALKKYLPQRSAILQPGHIAGWESRAVGSRSFSEKEHDDAISVDEVAKAALQTALNVPTTDFNPHPEEYDDPKYGYPGATVTGTDTHRVMRFDDNDNLIEISPFNPIDEEGMRMYAKEWDDKVGAKLMETWRAAKEQDIRRGRLMASGDWTESDEKAYQRSLQSDVNTEKDPEYMRRVRKIREHAKDVNSEDVGIEPVLGSHYSFDDYKKDQDPRRSSSANIKLPEANEAESLASYADRLKITEEAHGRKLRSTDKEETDLSIHAFASFPFSSSLRSYGAIGSSNKQHQGSTDRTTLLLGSLAMAPLFSLVVITLLARQKRASKPCATSEKVHAHCALSPIAVSSDLTSLNSQTDDDQEKR